MALGTHVLDVSIAIPLVSPPATIIVEDSMAVSTGVNLPVMLGTNMSIQIFLRFVDISTCITQNPIFADLQ